ncbi:MAG: ABC transporter permease, partial [Candidatus Hodarchaeota archaeon]
MTKFIKLSFKNLYENKRRSFLIGIIISICLLTLILAGAFQISIKEQMSERVIAVDTGHIQIRNSGIIKNEDIYLIGSKINWDKALTLDDPLIEKLKQCSDEIEQICGRLSFAGMFYAGDRSTRGLRIFGTEAEKEYRLKSQLPVYQGQFLNADNPYDIYLSDMTASALHVGVGDNISILCSTMHGAINAMDFNVCGIFNDCAPWHTQHSYINLKTAQQLIDVDDRVMEYKIFLTSSAKANSVELKIKQKISSVGLSIKTWEKAGDFYLQSLKGTNSMMKTIYLILFIIIFGVILDTMVLVMRERTRETGIMRAMGTTNFQIIRIYASEIIILTLISIIISILLSMIMILIL